MDLHLLQAQLLSQFYTISNWASAVPEEAFLWEGIYPKDTPKDGGLPRYNPYGKYAVRLYMSGLWRKVTIDDRIPFDEAGQCLFPTSSEVTEIWPVRRVVSYDIVSKKIPIVY